MNVLYLQKRPIRAGAQTSLARLVESSPLRELNPLVLLGERGWLEARLKQQGVRTLVSRFASSRSLAARLFGIRPWARSTAGKLRNLSFSPQAIVANDHQECPLAFALSSALGGIPVLGILRTPGMTQRDFEKYECERCDGMMAVGRELQDRLGQWTRKPVELFEEGFNDSEFKPPRSWPTSCPQRVIVLGSESPRKGFTDFIEAVHRLETAHPDFPGFDCDFTGTRTGEILGVLTRPHRSRFQFLGRVEAFSDRVRQYELAVHPSRAETFGLAPIESLIAGTPTLVSLTGVVCELSLPCEWVFPPRDIVALTERLAAFWRDWPLLPIARVQEQIRSRFHIDRTAGRVRAQLQKICLPPATVPAGA